MVKFNCIERPLKRAYARYGRFISHHPFVFLILPVILAGGLGTGILFLEKESDTEYLFTPRNGRAVAERREVETIFDGNLQDGQLPTRLTHFGRYGRAIVVAKDNLNILKEDVFADVQRLNTEILNIVILDEKNHQVSFTDVCLMWQYECIANDIFEVFNDTNNYQDSITYPYWVSTEKNKVYFLGSAIGGVILESNTSVILSGEALQLQYFLRDDSDTNELSSDWEDAFLVLLETFQSKVVDVTRYTSHSLEQELNKASGQVFGMFTIAFTLIINFSIWSCTKLDWVQNKPWLACLGVLSAGLAILSAFGVMGFCGIPFIDVVASTPILILSIGVDDMFIMLCSWRRTNIRSSVEDRMSETLSEAALSITITSLTDALAFGVGTITQFPSVQIFCIFTGVAVLFDYFYQVTFFAAAMVLTGRREAANRHCSGCNVVLPLDEAPSTSYKIFCAGGPSRKTLNHQSEDSAHAVMLIFRNYFAPFVCHHVVKFLTILFYCVYLAFSIFGVTQIEEGLELRNIASDQSYVVPFYDYETQYFKNYGPAVAVIFDDEYEYWKPSTQNELDAVVKKFENSEYTFDDEYTSWWLRDYLDYLEILKIKDPPKDVFLHILEKEFLKFEMFQQYSLDLVFNEDTTSIKASRFYVLTRYVTNSSMETAMMNAMREIADDVDVTVYHPSFTFTDQYEAVLPNTIQNLGIAIAAMFVVALLLIPQPVCALWVTFSIISMEVGVVGLMSFWDVKLDSVSMINIILCIGFSVDFSAHIAYAFSVANGSTNNDRAKEAFYALGMPIAQGACSTLLGIVVLTSSDVYIFRTFFKTLFLVMTLGVFHSLFVLPVLLMLFTPQSCAKTELTPQVAPVTCRSLHVDVLRPDGPSPTLSHKNTMEMNCKQNIDAVLVDNDAQEPVTDTSSADGKVNPTFEEE
ncbi:patched domain-containing protein 3-like [Antedon mediterranea]|uniref:patched domain-containing protein 3-like n=1 Tax=Antedon mediterranea TaxID=105859 RepID=UPI003AF7D6F8